MSLLEDIEQEIKKVKMTKKEKILAAEREIKIMLENKISLKKQIELLIKNEIVDSLDLKYYREILKNDFGYKQEIKKVKAKKVKFNSTDFNKTASLSKSVELKY